MGNSQTAQYDVNVVAKARGDGGETTSRKNITTRKNSRKKPRSLSLVKDFPRNLGEGFLHFWDFGSVSKMCRPN